MPNNFPWDVFPKRVINVIKPSFPKIILNYFQKTQHLLFNLRKEGIKNINYAKKI